MAGRTKKRPKGGNATRSPKAEWTPSANQEAMFEEVIRGELTQTKIGERFDVSPSVVTRTYQKVRAYRAKHARAKTDELRAELDAGYRRIIRESMRAWFRSMENAAEVKVTTSEKGEKTTKKSRGQSGNSAHLQQAREAYKELGKLWGVDVEAGASAERPKYITVVVEDEEQLKQPMPFDRFMEIAAGAGAGQQN